MRFVAQDKEYLWHPNDYLIKEFKDKNSEIIKENRTFSFGFLPGKRFILGATFMRNYEIHFDMNKGQTSFARCNCGQVKNFRDIYIREMSKQDVVQEEKQDEEEIKMEDVVQAEK